MQFAEYGQSICSLPSQVYWGFGASDQDYPYSTLSACVDASSFSLENLKAADVTIVDIVEQVLVGMSAHNDYAGKNAICLGIGPSTGGCADIGTCIGLGYSNVDACDYKIDKSLGVHGGALAGTDAFCSNSQRRCIYYQGPCDKGMHCWTMGVMPSEGTGYYSWSQLNCDLHWNDVSSLAELWNSCYVPGNPTSSPRPEEATCAGTSGVFDVVVGDKVTYKGQIWDSMSREYYIVMNKTDAGLNLDLSLTCKNSEKVNFCGTYKFWDGSACVECPASAPILKRGSLDKCVSCVEFIGDDDGWIWDPASKRCIRPPDACPWGEEPTGHGACAKVCDEDEIYAEFRFKNKDVCRSLSWTRLNGWSKSEETLIGSRVDKSNDDTIYPWITHDTLFAYKFYEEDHSMNFYLTCRERLRQVKCEYRPEGDAFKALSFKGVYQAYCCNNGYCATDSPHGEMHSPDEVGACWNRQGEGWSDSGAELQSSDWYSSFYYYTWSPDNVTCTETNLYGGKLEVLDSNGAKITEVSEMQLKWDGLSSTNGAVGEYHVCLPKREKDFAFMPKAAARMFNPSDVEIKLELQGDTVIDISYTGQQDPSTSLPIFSFRVPGDAPPAPDPVNTVNDCNYDSDCPTTEMCVINIPSTSATPSSARRLSSVPFSGSAIAVSGGVEYADLRSPGWMDYGHASVDGVEYSDLIVHTTTSLVADALSGDVFPSLRYERGRVGIDRRQSLLDLSRQNLRSEERRKLFGGMLRGLCSPKA